MSILTKDFDFEIKAVESNGSFIGYGSVFGNLDGGGEIVAKGAFAESLAESTAKGRRVPILWQHRTGEPIGVYDSVKEDNHGLLMEGRLLVEHVQRAKEAHALLKAGAVSGLSIGYLVRSDAVDMKTGVRTLKKLDLKETSIVTFPMNDEARVSDVKAKLIAGDKPTIREFEEFLREKGFTRSDAEHIAVHGFKNWQARECAAELSSDALAALKSFTLR